MPLQQTRQLASRQAETMAGRHLFSVGLWVATTLVLALGVVRGGPWLWERIFPGPRELGVEAQEADEDGLLNPERVAEELHRLLASWGAEPGPEVETVYLPQGRTPSDLQDALRRRPPLAEAQVYVTEIDELTHRLRVFRGRDAMLNRRVRTWLPERPVVSSTAPPRLAVIPILRSGEMRELRRVLRWKSPLAVGLHPFDPAAVKARREASWASKGVVLVVDPKDELEAQLEAVPEASGVLLEEDLPEGLDVGEWAAQLANADTFFLDGRSRPGGKLVAALEQYRVEVVSRSAHLGSVEAATVARNLTVRRGRGIVTVDLNPDGVADLQAFIETAEEDGFSLVLPSEVARRPSHPSPAGGPRAPKGHE